MAKETWRTPARTCEACRLYPGECGYWDDAKVPAGNRIKPQAKHGCPDYEPKGK